MFDLPQRKALRLANYDYSQNNLYFVTVCVQNRLNLFGCVNEAKMQRTPAAEMVATWWDKLPGKFAGVENDDFVLMPNHIHGIISLERDVRSTETTAALPTILQWFKTMTTNAYIRGVKELGWPAFEGSLWQRSYYDHIIRDEPTLLNSQQYIRDNPARWSQDTLFHL